MVKRIFLRLKGGGYLRPLRKSYLFSFILPALNRLIILSLFLCTGLTQAQTLPYCSILFPDNASEINVVEGDIFEFSVTFNIHNAPSNFVPVASAYVWGNLVSYSNGYVNGFLLGADDSIVEGSYWDTEKDTDSDGYIDRYVHTMKFYGTTYDNNCVEPNGGTRKATITLKCYDVVSGVSLRNNDAQFRIIMKNDDTASWHTACPP